MDFKITSRQKYLFITASTLLFFCFIFQGLPNSLLDNINFAWTLTGNLIFITSYGYVLYLLIAYFKFYSLQVLYILTTIILIDELTATAILILKSISTVDLSGLRTLLNVLTIIAEIIWLFYLIPLKDKNFSAIRSLYKYGISTIVVFFIAIVVTFNLIHSEAFSFIGIQNMLLAIPYIFLIDFGLKLNTDKTAST